MSLSALRSALVASALLTAGSASADIDAGAYLAARQAGYGSDYRAAADYYGEALRRDRSNTGMMDAAVTALLSLGAVDKAEPLARRLRDLGVSNQVTNLTLYAAEAMRGDWAAVLADLDAGRSVGPLYDGLLRAWALMGDGHTTEALAQFDTVAAASGTGAFGLYHKALALASAGDFEGAQALFSQEAGAGLAQTRRGLVAQVQVLSQLDRDQDALSLIDRTVGTDSDPFLDGLRAQLEAGDAIPFTVVQSPLDGVAELHYSIASAVSGEAADGYTLLYARLVEYLRPDHIDGLLLGARLLEKLGRNDLATEVYDKVPRDNPYFHAAELGRAQALREQGRTDAAIEVLTQLSKSHADLAVVHVTLGDLYRSLERYAEASAAYDRAIALLDAPDPSQWSLYFSRGITREREGRWPEAEADFRHALELQPDQPQVLNYLGYSFVEKGENMDEALDMIERAVAARPDSGYIVDSLAWALYKLGRYDEAIAPMEQAVELEPVDAIVNDHLGDVLWAVGRKLEARFQWQRALSFDPDPTDADRIRSKLKVGLDQVLADEGAPPLKMANGG